MKILTTKLTQSRMSRKEKPIRQTTKDHEKPRIEKRKGPERNTDSIPFVRLSELPFILIILAYIFIVTFTPNWMALDTNAPKFLTLSLVNIVAFIVIFFDKSVRNNPSSSMRFFTTDIGLAYSGFLVLSLISFSQAINLRESILQFAKLFSVFSATFLVSVILTQNMRLVKLIVIVMTGLLIFDAVSVFYNINLFIEGRIDGGIGNIKTIYSNKNILASSIFVKLPFALWLLNFEKGWLRRIGWVAITTGILATFFMATRAFYLGLLVLSLSFLVYLIINYFRKREGLMLKLGVSYIGAIVLAYIIFTFVQQNLYPKTTDRLTQGIAAQVASVSEFDTSTGLRISAWKWSLALIKDNPLLGVGSGNWKISILKHENQVNTGFIYLYKAHNDFLENAAETGILGGILFLSIFLFAGWNFIRLYRLNRKDSDRLINLAFLAATGLAFYAVDAFFNFPADRPEILILFIFFVAIGISSAINQNEQTKIADTPELIEKSKRSPSSLKIHPRILHAIYATFIIVFVSISVIFKMNFESSKLQRIVYQEIMAGTLRESSSRFVGKFPTIPNISIWGESIAAISARYLLEEKKADETIDLLMNDHSNPFDARREFFIALAYSVKGEPDSVLLYSRQAYELKPNYYRNLHMLLSIMDEKKQDSVIPKFIDPFLEKHKTEVNAWLFGTGFYSRVNDLDKAYTLIQEAREYLPYDSLIKQQERYLYHKKFIEPHADHFNKAMEIFNSGNHRAAVAAFNAYIEKVPLDLNAFRMRAFSLYQLKEFDSCIEGINEYLSKAEPDGQLLNLRGISYSGLGEYEKACGDYEASMKLGDPNGRTNFNQFCRNN
ncbi:MAG: O-antigen ligase family protein [Bacteroidales bacterium]|nr:O-antigen ligase family protein [Bacteroidales bacterium]